MRFIYSHFTVQFSWSTVLQIRPIWKRSEKAIFDKDYCYLFPSTVTLQFYSKTTSRLAKTKY